MNRINCEAVQFTRFGSSRCCTDRARSALKVTQRATKIIDGTGAHLSLEKTQKELGLFSMEEAQWYLTDVNKYLEGGSKEDGARHISLVHCARTRGNEDNWNTGDSL